MAATLVVVRGERHPWRCGGPISLLAEAREGEALSRICFFSKERERFFIRRAKSHSVKRVAWRWWGVLFPATKGRIGSVALPETDPLGPTGTRVLINPFVQVNASCRLVAFESDMYFNV